MRRHPALQDLSRDHFTALNHVVQVRRVVEGDEFAEPLDRVRTDFLAFARGELLTHFDEEESLLVPPLERVGADRLLERLHADHALLREGVAGLSEASTAPDLWAVAEALRVHARWEEEVLFESLQEALPAAELDRLGRESRAFRQERDRPVGPAA